jgi:O-antigen/teichoic acid export membrane protein
MSDSPLKRLIVQASHYSLASLFAMIAGLVTFPLLTRIFSLEDYGVMNLVAATITVSVAIGKVGVQHSILRYHSEVSAGKSPYSMPQLYATTFLGMAATGLLVSAALALGTQVAPARWLSDPRLRLLFAIAGAVIFAQVVESVLINMIRAELRTVLLMKYQIAKKYLGLGFIFVAVLVVARTLSAFYTATAITEVLAIGALAAVFFRDRARPRPRASEFSRPLYLELVALGVPMMIGYELSGIVLNVGDRYLIEWKLGEAPLGLYGAAYNLCQYIQAVVLSAVGQAIMPMYMKMWEEKGAGETAAFISRSLRTYVLFGVPVCAGLAAIGPELLPSLASEKYASASGVLPWVIAGMVADGANSMVGAGLFIHRKTRWIMSIVLSCALLNIALNLILIPYIGITGSAIATLVCYVALGLAMAIVGHHLLPVTLPWRTMARAVAVSVAMYFALKYVYPGRRWATVGLRLALGVPMYGGLMALIDEDARELLRKVLRKVGLA